MKIKGKKITYELAQRRLPDGRTILVDVIEHPGAALIVPFYSSQKIVFLRQFRAVIGKYLYELPAGTLDPNERARTCAHRELIEETGFRAKRLTKLGAIYPVPGYSTEVITIYKAQGLMPEKGTMDEDEVLQSLLMTKSQVRRLFKQGRIRDAKTICALAFCGWL
ncbi:MAG: NUDIX hydrolase [Candidatus Omnitrophota bacterium]|jgi:ADP-ribose pyrophosphatase|nr:NUDIX hydrolase [Candidatus Omnitrophota bacterium]